MFGDYLNSVLSFFNQALKNEHDAGNWMLRSTTNAFSHLLPQFLDTTEGIILNFSSSVMQYKTKSVMSTKYCIKHPT